MMPQNLNALFPMLSSQPGTGPLSGSILEGLQPNAPAEADWADIFARFESLAESAQPGGEAEALLVSLQEFQALSAQAEEAGVSEDLVGHFAALFEMLEMDGVIDPDKPGVLSDVAGFVQPHYEAGFWPDSGEMILLLQGINPWGEDLQPEQTQWLAQVGPYLGVPELTGSYAGPTELGREFTVVNLAEAAGADPQRAFVDAWLGRHKPEIAQNLYQSRWDWDQSRTSTSASLRADPALTGVRMSDMLELAREADLGTSRGLPDMNRSVLFSQMTAAQANTLTDWREFSSPAARADVSAAQLNPALVARDPALPPTTLVSGQPQSSAAEMRAAAEQAMERVVWMAARKQGVSQARLQLHPAHLGKLDIRLEVQGREASLHMSVHNAPVREAVEAMLPRLREQLEQQGLNLGDAWVFDSGPEDAPERERAMLAEAALGPEGERDLPGESQDLPRRGVGLLDEFA